MKTIQRRAKEWRLHIIKRGRKSSNAPQNTLFARKSSQTTHPGQRFWPVSVFNNQHCTHRSAVGSKTVSSIQICTHESPLMDSIHFNKVAIVQCWFTLTTCGFTNTTAKTELWELTFILQSYFWDPNQETLLPYKCPSCDTIIPAKKIEELIDPLNPQCSVTTVCNCCAHKFTFTPERMTGDPQN